MPLVQRGRGWEQVPKCQNAKMPKCRNAKMPFPLFNILAPGTAALGVLVGHCLDRHPVGPLSDLYARNSDFGGDLYLQLMCARVHR